MKQQTLAMAADQNAPYEQYRRPTRRDVFLARMEQIVPWAALCEVIKPHYPKPGTAARRWGSSARGAKLQTLGFTALAGQPPRLDRNGSL